MPIMEITTKSSMRVKAEDLRFVIVILLTLRAARRGGWNVATKTFTIDTIPRPMIWGDGGVIVKIDPDFPFGARDILG
jgi:hypothetical protein